MEKNAKSRQIDTKSTIHVRIDRGWHQLIKIRAAERNMSIKGLIQEGFEEQFAVDRPIIRK